MDTLPFPVQLAQNVETTLIFRWTEDDAPFVALATLRAKPRDSWAGEQVLEVDERVRFGIWAGRVAHRALGNINRARKPFMNTPRNSAKASTAVPAANRIPSVLKAIFGTFRSLSN
jgi:hypothetical protein